MNNVENGDDDVVSCDGALEPDQGIDHPKELEETKSEENFFIVKSRRSRKSFQKGKHSALQHDTQLPLEQILNRPVTEKRQDVLRKCHNCKEQLRESSYWTKFLDSLSKGFLNVIGSSAYPDGVRILCLGLGPFSSHLLTRIARYQLGLLDLLKEELKAEVEIFDPVFIHQEKSILAEDFEFVVLETNEEGRHRIDSPTVVFMPHCPHQLVNNFLYFNWNSDSLSKCFIVCNSISEALDSIPSKYVNENLLFIREASSVCTEIPLPNIFKDQSDVFNDLSLHIFPPTKFTNLSEAFWLDITPPIYTQQDFISNKSIYRELRHYDFGPGVAVRNSDTWKYIIEIARRNRITAMQNCQDGSEWPRIAETYLMYTQSSRIYGNMLEKTKQSRGGTTLIDAIKSQSKASAVLFELKRKRKRDINKTKESTRNMNTGNSQESNCKNQTFDDDSNNNNKPKS